MLTYTRKNYYYYVRQLLLFYVIEYFIKHIIQKMILKQNNFKFNFRKL